MNASESRQYDHAVDPRTDEPACPNCETDLYVFKQKGDKSVARWECGFCGVQFNE